MATGPSRKELLDADWLRLAGYSTDSPAPRRFRNMVNFRFMPVWIVRTAHSLDRSGWRRAARMLSMVNFTVFGLEVPPRLEIGPGLVIFHPQGTILGAARIGRNASIYQQVTLGATTPDFAYDLSKRPTIGDDVSITAGAKVIGGVMIGSGATIGANAVVLKDVPEGALAVGVPARAISIMDKA